MSSTSSRNIRPPREADGNLREVPRTIITSPEFFSAGARGVKVKTPLEFMVSAVRATGAEITNTRPWLRSLQQLGMPLCLCQPPTGYADTADAWVSAGALVNRMNVALDLEKTRSHFDAQDYMESATPGVKNGTAGEAFDAMRTLNASAAMSGAARLDDFSQSLAALVADLGDRMADTIILTMSEFGRTVAENGCRATWPHPPTSSRASSPGSPLRPDLARSGREPRSG